MNKELKQEFTLRITNASSTEMIVILYDMFFTYLEEAMEQEKEASYQEMRRAIKNARNCLQELANSLNYEISPAKELFSLYAYMNRQLSLASIYKDQEKLLQIMAMAKELREAFEEISKKDISGAIMKNVQEIHVGYTYGRNKMNQSVTLEEKNRGFRV